MLSHKQRAHIANELGVSPKNIGAALRGIAASVWERQAGGTVVQIIQLDDDKTMEAVVSHETEALSLIITHLRGGKTVLEEV